MIDTVYPVKPQFLLLSHSLCLLPTVSSVIFDCFVQPDAELLSPEISEIWVCESTAGPGYEMCREQLRAQEISTEKNITAVDADIFSRALRSHALIKEQPDPETQTPARSLMSDWGRTTDSWPAQNPRSRVDVQQPCLPD